MARALPGVVLDRLGEFGTIVFGRLDCPESQALRSMLGIADSGLSSREDGSERTNGPFFVDCAGSDTERQVCRDSGIQQTPVLVVAGIGYQGKQSEQSIRAALRIPEIAAARIRRAGGVLYGADRCVWTQRQKTVFGPLLHSEVKYVECTKHADECEAAGIRAVPVWKFPGGVDASEAGPSQDKDATIEGFQPLPVLLRATQRYHDASDDDLDPRH
jgi:hypothetical protein